MLLISWILLISFMIILLLRLLHVFFNMEKYLLTNGRTLHVFSLLLTILLFFVGLKYSSLGNLHFLELVFKSLRPSLETFALRFNSEIVNLAFQEVLIYRMAFYLCYISCILVTATIVLQLFFSKIVTTIKLNLIKKRKHTIVIGNSDDALMYIENSNDETVYWNFLNKEERSFDKQIINYKEELNYNNFKKIVKDSKGYFISFLENNQAITLLNFIENYLVENPKCNLQFFIKYDYMSNRFYETIMNSYSHKVHTFNPYEMHSRKLILEYPSSLFFSQNQIDYKTALIKPGVDINYFIMGYGKINQKYVALSLFNQLYATEKDGAIVGKEVNYYIYDKEKEIINKEITEFINYDIGKYNQNKYFELPKKQAKIINYQIDLFNNNLCEAICSKFNENSYNQIMIAFEDDVNNINLALKINEEILKRDINFNYKIFVRIENEVYLTSKHVAKLLQENKFVTYGTNKDIYTFENIVQEKLDYIAQNRNISYFKAKDSNLKDYTNLWNELNYNKKLSNRYSSASLNFKLALIGLTFTNNKEIGINRESFFSRYDYSSTIKKNEQKEVMYTIEQVNMSLNARQVLAFIEHERWNAFYLFRGYRPMPIDEIKVINIEDGKIYKDDDVKKMHACLTTIAGLVDYRKHLKELFLKENLIKDENDLDVIKYDFQLMDNIFEELVNSIIYITYLDKEN